MGDNVKSLAKVKGKEHALPLPDETITFSQKATRSIGNRLAFLIHFLFLEAYAGDNSSSICSLDFPWETRVSLPLLPFICLAFLEGNIDLYLLKHHQESSSVAMTIQGITEWPSSDIGQLCYHLWMPPAWSPRLVYGQFV